MYLLQKLALRNLVHNGVPIHNENMSCIRRISKLNLLLAFIVVVIIIRL